MASFKVHGGDFKEGNGSFSSGYLSLPKQGAFLGEMVPASELVSVDVVTQENKKKVLGTIGGGVAGAVLLGPIGAIGGMLLGGNKTNITFVATLSDGRTFVGTADAGTFAKLQGAATTAARQRTASPARRSDTAPLGPRPSTGAFEVTDGLSPKDKVARTFGGLGWIVSQPKKNVGSRYDTIHATKGAREVAFAICEDMLGNYNVGMMANSLRASYPWAEIVVLGKSVARDASDAGKDHELTIGVVDKALEIARAAIGDALTPGKANRLWLGR